MNYNYKTYNSLSRNKGVLKFGKFIDFKEEQPKNIKFINLINDILKFDKSIDFKEEQL